MRRFNSIAAAKHYADRADRLYALCGQAFVTGRLPAHVMESWKRRGEAIFAAREDAFEQIEAMSPPPRKSARNAKPSARKRKLTAEQQVRKCLRKSRRALIRAANAIAAMTDDEAAAWLASY